MSTSMRSLEVFEGRALYAIFVSKRDTSSADRFKSQHWLMYESSACVVRAEISGVTLVSPLCSETISTGSILRLCQTLRTQKDIIIANSRERFGCVQREHSDHDLVDNLQFCPVKSCNLNEDVLCVQCNLRMISIDNRWQRADGSVRVVNHRIHRRVSDDVKVSTKVFIFLKIDQHVSEYRTSKSKISLTS